MQELNVLEERMNLSSNKAKKKIRREISQLKSQHKHIDKDMVKMYRYKKHEKEIANLQKELLGTENYVKDNIQLIIDILEDYDFVKDGQLTEKGELAANIQEVHCMVFGEIFHEKLLNNLTIIDLVCVFSCFTNISVSRDNRLQDIMQTQVTSKEARSIINIIQNYYIEIEKLEQQYYIQGNNSDEMHYELCDLMVYWCSARNEQECKAVFSASKTARHFLG